LISRGGSTQHERDMETRKPVAWSAQIRFTGSGAQKADTMGRVKTRLRIVEEFAKLVVDAEARGDTTVAVPLVLAMVAAGCARNGVRPRQGRGGANLSAARKSLRARPP